jgi:hypothetical protein
MQVSKETGSAVQPAIQHAGYLMLPEPVMPFSVRPVAGSISVHHYQPHRCIGVARFNFRKRVAVIIIYRLIPHRYNTNLQISKRHADFFMQCRYFLFGDYVILPLECSSGKGFNISDGG